MKKLYLSCATLGAGGAERVISILSYPFADHYNEVKICLWISAPIFYKIDERVSIVDIEKESGSKNILRKMLWYRRYILSEKPDLILSFLYPWSMKVLISLVFTNVSVVVAERQDPRIVRGGWIVKKLRHLLYLKTKGILVQTNENKQYYTGSLNRKTFAIYNPVRMDLDWVGRAIRTSKTDTIVTVGRLNLAKNHKLLVNAFEKYLEKHPNYRLHIYGEGSLREELQNIIEAKGLHNSVHLMGNSKHVFSDIISAKAFVLSSSYEGMPNALLEAMCLGLPCISTKVSGATELIISGQNGLLVDNNEEDLMSAMELMTDESYAQKLALNAALIYDRVKVDFICNQWINYIDSLI